MTLYSSTVHVKTNVSIFKTKQKKIKTKFLFFYVLRDGYLNCVCTVHIKANLVKKQTKSLKTNDKYSNKKHDALITKQHRTEQNRKNRTKQIKTEQNMI